MSADRCVIEVVGVAGTGKSTVFDAFVRRDERIVGRLPLRALASPPQVVVAIGAAFFTLLRRRAIVRGSAVEQIRMMAQFRLLPRFLHSAAGSSGRYVLDQGPLYYLTRRMLTSPRLATWRDRSLRDWARVVDIVVWLDAPDDVACDRIDTRPKDHALKGVEREVAVRELGAARSIIAGLVAEAAATPGGPLVLTFDTARVSAADVVDGTLRACADPGAGRL